MVQAHPPGVAPEAYLGWILPCLPRQKECVSSWYTHFQLRLISPRGVTLESAFVGSHPPLQGGHPPDPPLEGSNDLRINHSPRLQPWTLLSFRLEGHQTMLSSAKTLNPPKLTQSPRTLVPQYRKTMILYALQVLHCMRMGPGRLARGVHLVASDVRQQKRFSHWVTRGRFLDVGVKVSHWNQWWNYLTTARHPM